METNGSYCKKLISYLVVIILKYKSVSFKQQKESIHSKKWKKMKKSKIAIAIFPIFDQNFKI